MMSSRTYRSLYRTSAHVWEVFNKVVQPLSQEPYPCPRVGDDTTVLRVHSWREEGMWCVNVPLKWAFSYSAGPLQTMVRHICLMWHWAPHVGVDCEIITPSSINTHCLVLVWSKIDRVLMNWRFVALNAMACDWSFSMLLIKNIATHEFNVKPLRSHVLRYLTY